jgi:hypothetical protein
MIDQEDHGLSVISVRREDLIQLIEAASSINHITNQFEVSEFHVFGSG